MDRSLPLAGNAGPLRGDVLEGKGGPATGVSCCTACARVRVPLCEERRSRLVVARPSVPRPASPVQPDLPSPYAESGRPRAERNRRGAAPPCALLWPRHSRRGTQSRATTGVVFGGRHVQPAPSCLLG